MNIGLTLKNENMEEIKAGDIMIGNYIRDIHSENGFFKVTTLRNCTAIYGNFYSARYEDLRGIPLTEDILLKAGFEKLEPNIDTISREEINEGKLRTVTIFSFHPFTFNTSNGWWMYNKYMENAPKYLHQLQNLFKSLTGNDLKIEV